MDIKQSLMLSGRENPQFCV